MTVEESSSQDATLIDDDLVTALGFEPVIEVSTDAPAGDPDEDDGASATNGSLGHYLADSGVVDDVLDTSLLDTSLDDTSLDDTSLDDTSLDDTSLDDDGRSAASAFDARSFDQVPSLVAEHHVDDFTAPVDLIDLNQVDLTDAPALGEEISMLADADTVFADAGTVFDTRTVFDVEADITETVPLVPPSETAVGAAAAATAVAATAQQKSYRRLRARKTRRVVRHIDPWSVLTFSVLFHMVVFAALLLSSVLVWNAAIASGMVENVESFIQELGDYETFEINADVMFRAAIVIAGMLTLASSVLVVLLTVVFNLISDLVGGIRVTVIEEETVRIPLDKTRGNEKNE